MMTAASVQSTPGISFNLFWLPTYLVRARGFTEKGRGA
jgi:hypothetical protein